MEISRRDFLRKAGMTAGLFTAPVSLPLFLAKEAQADPMTNEFKGNEIECNFTYIYNDKVSMVVDIIRHYKRIVFRGFIVAEGETDNFSRPKNLFPFPRPNVDAPFYCLDPKSGDMVSMGDLSDNTIEGTFKTPPVSFKMKFDIQDYRFSSLDSGLKMDELPALLKLIISQLDPTKLLSLIHEDYPLITVKEGEVKFKGKPYDLKGARGAMAHHWGWAFPNYVFLMCNGFEDPNTLLTLSCTETLTALGSDLLAGYLCVFQGEDKKKEFVSPINSSVQYFIEDDLLCIIARRPGDLLRKREIIRVNIDYKRCIKDGKAFTNFFNVPCMTMVDVPCEIIDMSGGEKSLGKSTRAVLDVKGFNLPP